MWKDLKFQAQCTTNMLNRSKQTVPHLGRSRAFVAARYNMRDENTGEEPDRIAFYKNTHYKDGKGWSCSAAKENFNRMKKIQDKAVEDGETPLTVDQIVDKVLDTTSEYIKGLGYGPKPITSRSTSSSVRTAELEESLRATREEASKLHDRLQVAKSLVQEQ